MTMMMLACSGSGSLSAPAVTTKLICVRTQLQQWRLQSLLRQACVHLCEEELGSTGSVQT
jgi:hypothetical protein